MSDENFLLVAASEHVAVMSELAPLIEDHCGKMNASILRVESALQAALMHNIEDSFAADNRLLSLSASRSQCKEIYAALSAIGEIELLYRPGLGKLKLLFQSPENLQQGIKLLSNVLDNVDIAYADSEFELRVERLPETDSQLVHIKQELKRRFDPNNKMNPLAKL